MNSKIMPYILPLASIVLISITALLFQPQITGFFVAESFKPIEIRITADEILPENAEIHIFLEKNGIAEEILISTVTGFVNKFAGEGSLQYKYGSNYEFGYEGFGYIGSQFFNININTDSIKSGAYTLKTEIYWHGDIISQTEQEVEV